MPSSADPPLRSECWVRSLSSAVPERRFCCRLDHAIPADRAAVGRLRRDSGDRAGGLGIGDQGDRRPGAAGGCLTGGRDPLRTRASPADTHDRELPQRTRMIALVTFGVLLLVVLPGVRHQARPWQSAPTLAQRRSPIGPALVGGHWDPGISHPLS